MEYGRFLWIALAFLICFISLVCSATAELRAGSLCDPQGTLREFTIFEKVVNGAAHKKCVCQVGYYGRYCERIFRCISGRPLTMNCTEPFKSFELATKSRCIISSQRTVDVCLCFPGYQGNRCEETAPASEQAKIKYPTQRNFEIIGESQEEEEQEISSFQDQDQEAMAAMERKFWYLAFCVALAAVVLILLIGLYFLIMQMIYKAGLKNMTERELRRRLGAYMKGRGDSISLPPSYDEVERAIFSLEEEERRRPSCSNTEETSVSSGPHSSPLIKLSPAEQLPMNTATGDKSARSKKSSSPRKTRRSSSKAERASKTAGSRGNSKSIKKSSKSKKSRSSKSASKGSPGSAGKSSTAASRSLSKFQSGSASKSPVFQLMLRFWSLDDN